MLLTFAGSLLRLTQQEKELLYAIAGGLQSTVALDAYSPGFFAGFYQEFRDGAHRPKNPRRQKGADICR